MATRTALVTGGNRGIGLEVCRQLGRLDYRVVLAARDPAAADQAARELRAAKLDVLPEVLDVTDDGAAGRLAERLAQAGERVDVLVNNAGVYPPGDLLSTPPEVLRSTMDVNFFGAVWAAQAFVPAMLARGYGRVVNVSSGYGQLSEGLSGPAAYSLSKAALNALTIRLASEVHGDVKVNAACPGWVRTRMGGSAADRSVEEGADTIVWLATLPASGPSGGLFRDRTRVPW
jgi:NAD(P)-dependent dehydrogenase (short-subunit alcohol dehydrogenase family)